MFIRRAKFWRRILSGPMNQFHFLNFSFACWFCGELAGWMNRLDCMELPVPGPAADKQLLIRAHPIELIELFSQPKPAALSKSLMRVASTWLYHVYMDYNPCNRIIGTSSVSNQSPRRGRWAWKPLNAGHLPLLKLWGRWSGCSFNHSFVWSESDL